VLERRKAKHADSQDPHFLFCQLGIGEPVQLAVCEHLGDEREPVLGLTIVAEVLKDVVLLYQLQNIEDGLMVLRVGAKKQEVFGQEGVYEDFVEREFGVVVELRSHLQENENAIVDDS